MFLRPSTCMFGLFVTAFVTLTTGPLAAQPYDVASSDGVAWQAQSEVDCDLDEDGYENCSASCACSDCNDDDASVHPGALEVCSDAVDNDCDSLIDCDDDDCVTDANCSACEAPVQLTDNSITDIDPEWDPASDTIAFLQQNEIAFYDIWSVQASGAGLGLWAEQEPGFDCPFDLGWSLAWVGSTGQLMTSERCVFWEYLAFDTSQAPFVRTVFDGDDAAFTRKLSITGGDGGSCIDVARDGSTAVWCNSRSSGSDMRAEPFANLTGQDSDTLGTVVVSNSDGTRYESALLSVSPDGTQVVIADKSGSGVDLFLHNTDGTGGPVQITTSGASLGATNSYPEFHPEGERVLYASNEHAIGSDFDLYEVGIDGQGIVNLTNSPSLSEVRPTYDGSGTRIAFDGSDTGSDREIYVLDCGTGPTLAVSGNCPSGVTFEISGGTPGGTVAVGWSTSLGSTVIPVGPCAGTEVGLTSPELLATLPLDEQGGFSLSRPLPPQACNVFLQVVDLETCEVSNTSGIE